MPLPHLIKQKLIAHFFKGLLMRRHRNIAFVGIMPSCSVDGI